MNILSIKIISIFGIVFCHGVFADSYEYKPSDITTQPFQHVSSDTNKAGIIRTIKTNKNNLDSSIYKITSTFSDKDGNLIHSVHQTLKNGYLVQIIYNGIVKNIIRSNPPCDFMVTGHNNDTIFFHFEPEIKYDYNAAEDISLINEIAFKTSARVHEYIIKDTSHVYSPIKYSLFRECRYYYYEALMRENEKIERNKK